MTAVCLASILVLCRVASGQGPAKYDQIKLEGAFAVFKDAKEASKLERAFSSLRIARDLSKVDSKTQGMAKFYMETYIPWKLTQKEYQPEYSSTVENLLKSLDGVQRMGGAGLRNILVGTFVGMKKLATGNYPPPARINAINALARINEKPLDIANKRPPVPLKYSFPILLGIYKDAKNPDGVRAAALHGLHSYTSLAFAYMTPQDRTAAMDAAKSLLAAPAPAGRTDEVHAYLQRFAVDIVDTLSPVNDPDLGTQLISISTSEANPDIIALYSAAKLGSIRKGLEGKVADTPAITKHWSVRAFTAIDSERNRIAAMTRPAPAMGQPPNPRDFLQKSVKKKRPAATARGMGNAMGMDGMDGMGMDMGMDMEMGMEEMDMGMEMGMMGMGMGMGMGMMTQANPQPPAVLISRRKLVHVLEQLLRGATGASTGEIHDAPGGLTAAVNPQQKAELTAWIDQIKAVLETLNDPNLDDEKKWGEAIDEQRRALAALAGVEIEDDDDKQLEDDPEQGLPGLPGFGPPAQDAGLPGAAPGLPGAAPAGAPALPGFG